MKTMKSIGLLAVGSLLFLGVVSGLHGAETGQPIAQLPETQYEFESVPEGTQIHHGVKVQNKGTAPLKLEKVETG